MLFPKPRDIVREATAGTPKTSQVRGVATGDSSDGSVTVILDTVAGGDNAEMTIPTAGGIVEGADVIVTLLDGTPVGVDQPGSIDSANARIDVLPDQIISTVSQTYATKDEALNTASGSGRSITTTDAAGLPLRDLTVYGESIQDGTPTPDAPVEIRTVRGMNLADPSAFQNGYMAATAAGTVDPGLAAQSATMKEQTTAYIPVIAGESYTFYTANSSGEQGWLAYRFFDSAYTTIANRPAKAYAEESASFDDIVAPSNAAYVRMSARMYDDGVMMVSRSAMPFVPYGSIGIGVTHDGTETVTPIDLQGHTLASLPDGTQDVLHVENGQAWIEKNVGKLVFDGDETVTADRTKAQLDSWAIRGTYDMDWKYSTRADRRVLSDQDTVTSSYAVQPSLWSAATTPGVSVWNDGVYIRATKSLFANADAVESWLSANPLQILYPLLDTEIIDLGEVSLPTVQDGDTVRIIAEVTPEFDTSWWRDTAIVEYTAQNETRITQTEADVTTAVTTAQAAQDAVDSISTIIRQYADGVLVCKTGNTVGALVNANGSFDVVSVTWSGTTPTAGNVLASFDEDDIKLAASTQNATIDMLNGAAVIQAITTFLAGADRTSFGIKSNDVALYGDNTIVLQIGDVPESGGTAEICGFSVRKNIGSSVQYLNAPFEPDGTFPMSGAQLTNLIVNWNGVRVFTTGDMHAQNNNDGRAIKYSPDVLFYDENAALGNEPTLNDTLAGYNRARIYAKDNNDYVTSVDVVNPDGKYINVFTSYPDTSAYWVNSTIYLLSGTSITISRTGNYELIGNIAQYSSKQIAITRVEAWIE